MLEVCFAQNLLHQKLGSTKLLQALGMFVMTGRTLFVLWWFLGTVAVTAGSASLAFPAPQLPDKQATPYNTSLVRHGNMCVDTRLPQWKLGHGDISHIVGQQDSFFDEVPGMLDSTALSFGLAMSRLAVYQLTLRVSPGDPHLPLVIGIGHVCLAWGYRCYKLRSLKSSVLHLCGHLWRTGSVFDKFVAAPVGAWAVAGHPQQLFEPDATVLSTLWTMVQAYVLLLCVILAALALLALMWLLARVGIELTYVEWGALPGAAVQAGRDARCGASALLQHPRRCTQVARLVVGGTMYDYLVDFMTWAVRCKTGDSMGSPHTLPERPATPSNNTKQASNKHKADEASAGISIKADGARGSGVGSPSTARPPQQPIPRTPVTKPEPFPNTSRVSQSVAAAAWPSLSRPGTSVTDKPVMAPTLVQPPPRAAVKKLDGGSHVAQSASRHRRAASSDPRPHLTAPKVGAEMFEDHDMALALALSMEVSGAQHLAELQTAAVQRVTVSEGRPGGVSLLKQLSSGSYEYDELEGAVKRKKVEELKKVKKKLSFKMRIAKMCCCQSNVQD